MALTNAEKQSAHRKRVAGRLIKYEKALREIAEIHSTESATGMLARDALHPTL